MRPSYAGPVCLLQVQQLILDPAIEHEFQHLRAQLALRVSETEAAKAAYEGQAFTAVSHSFVAQNLACTACEKMTAQHPASIHHYAPSRSEE